MPLPLTPVKATSRQILGHLHEARNDVLVARLVQETQASYEVRLAIRLKCLLEACCVGDADANQFGKKPIDLASQGLTRREQCRFRLAHRIDERAHVAPDPVSSPEIRRVGESRQPAGGSREQKRKVGGSRRDLKQVQGDDGDEVRGAFDRASFKGRQERRQPLDQRWRQVSLGRLRQTRSR